MKKIKTPTAVTTAVLTLITIFFWAGFEVYRTLTIKPAPTVPATIVNPLEPTLDTKTLDTIPQRLFLDDSQIGNTTLTAVIPTPIPSTPTPLPTASISATLAPTSTASASATPTASASATPSH